MATRRLTSCRAGAPAGDPPGGCCWAMSAPSAGRCWAVGCWGFLGGLASLAQPLVAKLVVDTLSQRRSLVGPVRCSPG